MTRHVPLNNVDHAGLKIITTRSSAYGDSIRFAQIVPREFRQVESYYPIVFRKKSDNGQFESVALFGFDEKENLFLQGEKWDADYIPLSVIRIPFAVGYFHDAGEKVPTIHIDIEHHRVSKNEGEPLFLPHGGNSEYLEYINSVLAALIDGLNESDQFIEILLKMNLLEPFTFKARIQSGDEFELTGFYTINEEKLRQLNGSSLELLHNRGFLDAVFMAVASMSRIRSLIKKKESVSKQ